MLARRILISVLITLAVLGVARRVSTRRPIEIEAEKNGVRVNHRTITEQVGPGEPLLSVRVEPQGDVEAIVEFGRRGGGGYEAIRMAPVGGGVFEARLPDLGKGARGEYAVIVRNGGGASIRLPEDREKHFTIKYKGTASETILVSHIVFMFASFFCMVLGLFGAIRILKGLEGKRSTVSAGRWVLLLCFIGGWPLGFALNYQTFGTLWEGYPFGYDVTDNKTQVMFVFWLVSLLLVRGSFFGRGEGKDLLGARAFAWAIVASFVASLLLFILPHSI